MNILIHDRHEINKENLIRDKTDKIIVLPKDDKIHPCTCCFGCWIKMPGKCVINDGYNDVGLLLSKCNQLILISQCFYGSYSPFVKNVLDRIVIPYQLPYFTNINGETRHPKRYENNITFSVHFYGEITENEKKTARKLVNKINFYKKNIYFYNTFEEIQGVL